MLPRELLVLVLSRGDSEHTLCAARRVCREWYAASSAAWKPLVLDAFPRVRVLLRDSVVEDWEALYRAQRRAEVHVVRHGPIVTARLDDFVLTLRLVGDRRVLELTSRLVPFSYHLAFQKLLPPETVFAEVRDMRLFLSRGLSTVQLPAHDLFAAYQAWYCSFDVPGVRPLGYMLGIEARETSGRVVVHLAASSGGWEQRDVDYLEHAEALLDGFTRLCHHGSPKFF